MSKGGENIPSGIGPTSSQKMVDKGEKNIPPGIERTSTQKMVDKGEQNIAPGKEGTSSQKMVDKGEQNIAPGKEGMSNQKMVDEGEKNIPPGIERTSSQKMVDKEAQNVAPGKDGTSSQKMDIKRDLFKNTMKGEWEKVVEMYSKHPEVHMFQITRSGETALHIAISENEEKTVEALIKLIDKAALKIQNKIGSTPLHFAAALGSLKMCKLIVKADGSLVGVPDNKGETPYFVAAAHGKKEVFLYLHSICGTNLVYARRLDGDSILHLTIYQDYFDLAFWIIHLYQKTLVDSFNQEGMLPFHLLASKPSAFYSNYQIGPLKTIIYKCIFVNELNMEAFHKQTNDVKNQNNEENVSSHKSSNYPQIYTTCMEFLHFLDYLLGIVICFRCKKQPDVENPKGAGDQGSETLPPNFGFAKRAFEVLGLGPTTVRKISDDKKKHTWALQVMNDLLELTSMYEDDVASGTFHPQDTDHAEDETKPYEFEGDQVKISSVELPHTNGRNDQQGVGGGKNIKKPKELHGETLLLLAAKHGIIEIVKEILKKFPIAKYDRNKDMKNIVLLAIENRQPHVYQLLLKKDVKNDSLFSKVDIDGNSALHLAAKQVVYKPWRITGAALQMQWEFKWYEFVRTSMPVQFYPHNGDGETPKDVFSKTHENLSKEAGEWLTKTSESCSVVAALIAGVAFATSSTYPGGAKDKSGTPKLENQPAFGIFAISSVVALSFSIMALIMFLAILTSRYRDRDFGKQLPRRLLMGLTSLFISIASVLVSFSAAHFFVLKDKLKYATLPVYAVTCLPATYFLLLELPLYFDVIFAIFRKIPKRSYEALEL